MKRGFFRKIMYIFATEKMNERMMMFLIRKNKKITIRNGDYVYVYYKISSSPTLSSSSDCVCVVSYEGEDVEIPVKDFNGD